MTEWDVLVAGGGPAGAVCAIELSRRGRRVLLLEAEHPPRYRVGESLSPSACAALSGYDVDLTSAGFVAKSGATLVWGEHGTFSTYYPSSSAWQVRRDELDARLLDRARSAGVRVQTGARVQRVRFDGDRVSGVAWVTADGDSAEAEPRWLIDATGRDALLARDRGLLHEPGLRRDEPALDRQAVWAYWRGGRRLPGRAAGNTLLVGGDPAWWYLPVGGDEDLIGVGLVGAPPAPGTDPTTAYLASLAGVPLLRALLTAAEQVGPVRWTAAPVQTAGRLCGPNWTLVGDAAGFVDPLLTPGVQVAVESGALAGRTVHASLDRPEAAGPLGREYDRRFRRQLETFRWLATNLYAAAGPLPAEPPPAELLAAIPDGDEQADRLRFMSVISGLPVGELPALLGGYLQGRGAAGRYGAAPPVFGETEGFAFLSWLLRRPGRDGPPLESPDLTDAATVRLATGAGVVELALPPDSVDGAVRQLRVAHNRAGDRFLLTTELAGLLDLLAEERSYPELARRFAALVDAELDRDAFRRWLQLLSRHGLVACRTVAQPADREPAAAARQY
ncbi:MAG: NAD(P)/FAD-dependent oxidoreductase [Natronosporangium sp.]